MLQLRFMVKLLYKKECLRSFSRPLWCEEPPCVSCRDTLSLLAGLQKRTFKSTSKVNTIGLQSARSAWHHFLSGDGSAAQHEAVDIRKVFLKAQIYLTALCKELIMTAFTWHLKALSWAFSRFWSYQGCLLSRRKNKDTHIPVNFHGFWSLHLAQPVCYRTK